MYFVCSEFSGRSLKSTAIIRDNLSPFPQILYHLRISSFSIWSALYKEALLQFQLIAQDLGSQPA
jgi:hypothetical protein